MLDSIIGVPDASNDSDITAVKCGIVILDVMLAAIVFTVAVAAVDEAFVYFEVNDIYSTGENDDSVGVISGIVLLFVTLGANVGVICDEDASLSIVLLGAENELLRTAVNSAFPVGDGELCSPKVLDEAALVTSGRFREEVMA